VARQRLLQLTAIRKSYNVGTPAETEVLHGVDLALDAGEFVALIGPSGSGKSTLLNIMGLLDRPSSGQMFIAGRETANLPEAQLTELRGHAIGFVFQSHFLLSAFTAIENVMMPFLIRRGRADEAMREAARRLLAQVELEEGLERIRCGAFSECTSLTHIRVPSTVIEIEQGAFKKCDNSLAVEFCDEIEELMSYSAVLDWWNVGAAEVSLKIFKLLVQHNLAQRLGLLKASKWR